MSSDGNESSSFLNKAVPLALFAILVVAGFYMLMTDGPPLVLAMLAVIAATLTYIFLAKPLRQGAGDGGSLLSPEMTSDLTKTIEIGARMDQIVADIEQLKQREGGGNVDALKRDIAARMEHLAAEIQEVKQDAGAIDTADITQAINTRFEQVMAEIEDLKQSGGSVDVSELRRELDTRLAQIAGDIEDVRQVGGGIDTQDIQREMRARLDEIMTEIEDLRARGGGVDVESIKEQLATLQVYQTSAALSEKDRIDRISSKVNALQRLPDDVNKLKEGQRLSETERDKIAAGARDMEEQLTTFQARLDETASVDRVQGWMGELREDMESIESSLKGFAQASDLKTLSDELAPQLHSLQKLVIELQDPTKIKELVADIEKIKERIPMLAAANDVEMLAEHVKQQVRELNGIIDETDQTEAVQQLRAKLAEEISGLRQELQKAATAEEMEEAADAVKAQMAEISARLDGVTAKELEERFANLRNEIRKVRESLSAVPKTQDVHKLLSEVRAEAAEQGQEAADSFTAAAEAREALSGEMSELRENLANLREKSQEIAALRTRLDEAATVEHVKEWLSELRESVAAVENRLEESAAAEDLKALKEEFTPQMRVLQKAVGEMKDPKKLNDVAADVESIKEQLAEFAGTGDLDDFTKGIEQQMEELAKTVRETDQTHAVRELRAKTDQGLEEIRGRLAGMSKRVEVEEATASIKGQLAELSSRLEGITAEELEGRLDSLSIGIGALKEELSLAPKSEEIEEIIAGIRDDVNAQLGRIRSDLEAESEARENVSSAVSELRAKLSELSEITGEIAALESRMDDAATAEKVQVWLGELRAGLADVQEGLGDAAQAADMTALREELTPEIEALQRTVAELKDTTKLDGLSAQVDVLNARAGAFASSSEIEVAKENLKRQIAELRNALEGVDQTEAVEELQARVNEELEAVKTQLQAAAKQADVQEVAEDIRGQVTDLASRLDRFTTEELGKRLDGIMGEVDSLKEALEAAVTSDEVHKLAEKVEAETSAVSARVKDLAAEESQARLSELRAEIDQLRESLSTAVAKGDVQELMEDMREEVGAQLQKLEGALAAESGARDEMSGDIEKLQEKLHEVSEAASEIVTIQSRFDDTVSGERVQNWIADIREDVDGLRDRLQDMASVGEVKAVSEELAPQVEALQQALDEVKESTRLDDLVVELDGMKEQLAVFAASSEVEATAEEVRQQIAELRKILDETDQAQAVIDLQTDVRRELDEMQKLLASRPVAEDIEKATGELRAQMADLSSRVDQLAGEGIEERMSAVTEEVAALRDKISSDANRDDVEELMEHIRNQTAALAARVDGLGVSELRKEFSGLEAQVSRLAESVSAPSTEEGVRKLVEEIREEVSARVEDLSLSEYQAQLSELKNEIEGLKATAPAAAVDEDLQKLLSDMREEIAEDIKRMEEAVSARPGAPEEVPADIQNLRQEVSELSHVSAEVSLLWERLAELKWGIKPDEETEVAGTRELEQMLAGHRREIDALSARLDGLSAEASEELLAELRSEIEALKEAAPTAPAGEVAAEDVSQLVDDVRAEVAERIQSIESALSSESDAHEELEGEISALRDKLDNVSKPAAIEIDLGNQSLDRAREWVDELRGDVQNLQAKLEDAALRSDLDGLGQELTSRMEAFHETAGPREAESLPEEFRAAIDTIKAQVEELSSRPAGPAAEELDQRLAEVQSELDEVKEGLASASVSTDIEAQETASRIRTELSDRLQELEDDLRAEHEAKEEVSRSVAELRDKIEEAGEAAREIASVRQRIEETASVDKVQEWIGELHTDLNELEKKLADTATAANIKALREELKPHVEALEQTIEELKDPARLDRLTEEIDSIKEQLSAFVSASEIEAVSADMRQQVDELKETLSDVDVQQAIEELRAQFTERLDTLTQQVEARTGADDIAKVAAELKEQVAEVASRVNELAEEELRPRIFEINDEIKALKEAVSSATETEEAKGLLEQARAEVSEQLSAIQGALSTESDAREHLSEEVAALEEKLARVSEATAEIDQLWERLAEVKWGLTPTEPTETTEPPRGMDQMLDTMRGEIAGMATRLDGLDMDEAQRQLSELRNEIQALKDVASTVPTDGAPSGPPRQVSPIVEGPAPPPSKPGSELSGGITEVTSLKDFEAGEAQAAPPIDAGRETEAMAPLPEAKIAGTKLLHISNPTVQSLLASYSNVAASMDRVLDAVREDREDNELRETWQAAQELTVAMAENSRILVSLASRPYEDGVKMIANHAVNVFLLALRASEAASMSEDERAALGGAALFHDIGVMRLPQDAVVARSSSDGQAEQRKYPEYSAQLLQELGNELLCTLVLQTHEREDGAGFPKGLPGPQIHPLAKLLHVADVFDALVHIQSHVPPQPFEAMKMLENEVGTSLNAEAFHLFREAIGPFPVGTIVELNTRERAKVIDVKARETLRPAVAVLTDAHGEHLSESRFLDLQESAELFMARALVDEELKERARDIF